MYNVQCMYDKKKLYDQKILFYGSSQFLTDPSEDKVNIAFV